MMLYRTEWILKRIKGKWFHVNSATTCYVEDHLLNFNIEVTKGNGSRNKITLTKSPDEVSEGMADFLLYAFYKEFKS